MLVVYYCGSVEAKRCNSNITGLTGNYMRTFECSDGNTYVVKFYNEGFGKRILPNEYVSGLLAKYLGMPCHNMTFVNVDKHLLENENLSMYSSGIQLGIKYDHNSNELSPFRVNKVHNQKDIASILVFDQWIYNPDRGNQYCNWLISNNDGLLTIIDHSEAFGCRKWETSHLLSRLGLLIKYTKSEYAYVKLLELAKKSFDVDAQMKDFIDRIVNIPDKEISDIINSVPDVWNVSADDKSQMLNYLMERRKNLHNLVFNPQNRILVGVG